MAVNPFFQQRPDATGKLGILSLLKVTAALCMMAYGSSADSMDENLEMGESTCNACLFHFTNSIISIFGDEYLRHPSEDDLKRLLLVSYLQGFPGMLVVQ